ncbi:MAG: hypothetical protein HOP21_06310 [Methylotenera sp.]|nr:hypothetical protein [Methylotenera sp.]
MKLLAHLCNLLILLLVLPSSVLAENNPLTKADLQKIETLQRQASQLELDEHITNPYALYQAQAWLDFAQSEYYAADLTGIVQAAILGASKIGLDQSQPVANCKPSSKKTQIQCLQPNRRVEVIIKGEISP